MNELTPKQERTIAAVLSARTIDEGLLCAKISKSTFYGWLKEPHFAAAYQQARRDIVQRAYSILEQHLGAAADALAALLNSGDERTKRLAAVNIIDLYSKHAEAEELSQRVMVLEEKILKK